MAKIVVDGRAYDTPQSFKLRELSTFKRISGIEAGQMEEALERGDIDAIVALTVISMHRAGNKVDPEWVYELDLDQLQIEGDEPSEAPTPLEDEADEDSK